MTEKTPLKQLYKIRVLQNPNVVFGSRKGKSEDIPYFVRRLIAAEDLTAELAARVLRHLSELAKFASPEDLKEYDASYAASEDEPRYLKIADDPVIAGVVGSITENTANLDPFKKDERGNMRLSYYCLQTFDEKGEELRFYNGMSPGKQLKATRGVQAYLRGNKFVAATETPLIFDPNFLCVTYKGTLFVFGTGGFETLFHYYDDLKAHAAETLDTINKTNVGIDDFGVLKEAVLANKSNLKRLRGITKRGHLKAYTVASMNTTIKKFKLSVTVTKGEDGRPHLHWEPGQEKEVLRLLDDYYLTSETSQLHYGANSKELLKAE